MVGGRVIEGVILNQFGVETAVGGIVEIFKKRDEIRTDGLAAGTGLHGHGGRLRPRHPRKRAMRRIGRGRLMGIREGSEREPNLRGLMYSFQNKRELKCGATDSGQ